MNRIVVGIAEPATSAAAVQWAGAQAQRSGSSLEILRALQYPSTTAAGMGAWYPDDLMGELDSLALTELEEARASVSDTFPDLEIDTRLVHTHPRLALTRASETARMVVTGARRRRTLAGALLGSTSMHVAAHSRCPTAVIHAEPVPGARGVVVGYDGSPAADEAVTVAAEQASAVGEELLVVHAWFLEGVVPVGFEPTRYVARSTRQEADQRHRLEQVARTVADLHPGLVVRADLLVDGFASDGLVTAALTARLLVVGSRGHGAFASMLLGSTSSNVLQHTLTPVIVVPDRVRVAGATPLEADDEEDGEAVRPPVGASGGGTP
ncbi:universal stress protein [Kineococcus sp. R86509]|uniref:universal stress protein n=1 Tax=Kineococcus sp. R86509 TaxID=3093851 RepID=UPI0036D41C3B